ncbi:MAG: DUF4159 domain-containing protein [Acidobacteria bacterium]|nr:DUF4159 domain-containing protein [Acidobacteriota bacterium]MCI0662174.1 DUF4159 domain-containing protein [Acidobacteriota bacterium]
MRRAVVLLMLLLCISLLSSSVQSQRFPSRSDFRRPKNSLKDSNLRGEFTFARLRYDSYGWEGWTTDYPKADQQFIYGLRSWVRSRLEISDEPTAVSVDEKEIFQHPFIYIVEPGHMVLSEKDAANLREYLLRGGFLMLDDFWGSWEYENVREQLHKVFPEHQIRELPLDHPIFHCYFDIDEVLQVPQFFNYLRGRTHERDGYVPHYMAITDENNRVMVFIARNTDNGDAWEWIDDPRYPLKYGLGAYRLGMNCIVYAMTH